MKTVYVCLTIYLLHGIMQQSNKNTPRHEKTCLLCLKLGYTQTTCSTTETGFNHMIKQLSETEIHKDLENSTCGPLKFTMGRQIASISQTDGNNLGTMTN